MKRIQLTQSQFAIIDDEDAEIIAACGKKWSALFQPHTNSFYAVRCVGPRGQQIMLWMHRVILGLGHGDPRVGDHLNHDTLDNRRANLRITTHRGNHENRKNQSRYGPGIQRDARHKSRPFAASAYVNGKTKHIGRFATADAARNARARFLETIDGP